MTDLLGKGIRYYLVVCGLLFNLILVAIGGYAVSMKVAEHWRWKQLAQWWQGPMDDTRPMIVAPVSDGVVNPGYQALPKGKWVKIHQQTPGDPVRFRRQRHAGSAFDRKRGELILFGSDTHGKNWDNAVYTFSMARLGWRRSYSPDPPESYRVNDDGIPVAGPKGDHPWAMHTFDAVMYDRKRDALIVASYPGHLKPGRFGNWTQGLWEKIKKHPTWIFDLGRSRWRYAEGKAVDFFPYATAYDGDRDVAVGFKPYGIYEFDGRSWKKVGAKSYYAYHTVAVYGARERKFVLYGANDMRNDVYLYTAGDDRVRKMPTPGQRPPGSQHQPMAYHERLRRTVVLIDGEGGVATWLYDAIADRWQELPDARFPFRVGMNYMMQYDPGNDLLVLVASPEGEETAVWVLRL